MKKLIRALALLMAFASTALAVVSVWCTWDLWQLAAQYGPDTPIRDSITDIMAWLMAAGACMIWVMAIQLWIAAVDPKKGFSLF